MKRRHCLLGAGLLLLGAPAAAAPPEEPVTVSLRVESQSAEDGRRRAVSPMETLRQGERIALRIEVDRPAFVYVAQVAADGKLEALFPRSGERRLAASAPVRLPDEPQWFEVQQETGVESIYVIASTQPLAQADSGLCARLQLPCATAAQTAQKPPPPPPPPPPGNQDITTRGHRLAGKRSDRTLRGRTDEGGVAVLRFSFRHARR